MLKIGLIIGGCLLLGYILLISRLGYYTDKIIKAIEKTNTK